MPRAVLIGGTGHDRPRCGARPGDGRLGGRRASRAPARCPRGSRSWASRRLPPTARTTRSCGPRSERAPTSSSTPSPMNREHGEQLNGLAGLAGSLVVISSASVYADDEGRALDGESEPAASCPSRSPRRSARRSQATRRTRRGRRSSSRRCSEGPLPSTLVRACAIHGPGAKLPRELYFVKRAHDGRRRVALAFNGESRFHTTSVANLAELIRLAAAQPGDRALNAGDPDPPTTLEICHGDRRRTRLRVRARPAAGR